MLGITGKLLNKTEQSFIEIKLEKIKKKTFVLYKKRDNFFTK